MIYKASSDTRVCESVSVHMSLEWLKLTKEYRNQVLTVLLTKSQFLLELLRLWGGDPDAADYKLFRETAQNCLSSDEVAVLLEHEPELWFEMRKRSGYLMQIMTLAVPRHETNMVWRWKQFTDSVSQVIARPWGPMEDMLWLLYGVEVQVRRYDLKTNQPHRPFVAFFPIPSRHHPASDHARNLCAHFLAEVREMRRLLAQYTPEQAIHTLNGRPHPFPIHDVMHIMHSCLMRVPNASSTFTALDTDGYPGAARWRGYRMEWENIPDEDKAEILRILVDKCRLAISEERNYTSKHGPIDINTRRSIRVSSHWNLSPEDRIMWKEYSAAISKEMLRRCRKLYYMFVNAARSADLHAPRGAWADRWPELVPIIQHHLEYQWTELDTAIWTFWGLGVQRDIMRRDKTHIPYFFEDSPAYLPIDNPHPQPDTARNGSDDQVLSLATRRPRPPVHYDPSLFLAPNEAKRPTWYNDPNADDVPLGYVRDRIQQQQHHTQSTTGNMREYYGYSRRHVLV